LLDKGFGAAGVAIDSVPPEGIHVSPLSQLKAIWPAVKNPSNRHDTADFTFEQFQYAFVNTLPEDDARRVYDEQYIPGPGPIVFGGLAANLKPGHQDTYVNFKNDDRAPLLLIAGGEDHIMPPAVNKSNFKHYKSDKAITEYKEFEGRSHYTCGEPGWEEVADYALAWAAERAVSPAAA
jgi:pimeloyl-ACP methyl ester carboxylesterase